MDSDSALRSRARPAACRACAPLAGHIEAAASGACNEVSFDALLAARACTGCPCSAAAPPRSAVAQPAPARGAQKEHTYSRAKSAEHVHVVGTHCAALVQLVS